MFISDISLKFSFLFGVSTWFWYQDDASIIEWVQKYAFPINFLELSEKGKY